MIWRFSSWSSTTRMRLATVDSSPSRAARSGPRGLALDPHGNPEGEGRSPADRRLDPDPATVELDDPSGNGEPEPRPALLPRAGAVRLLELLEDPLPVRLGDPRPRVGDGHDEGVAVPVGRDPHRANLRELDGVADQ